MDDLPPRSFWLDEALAREHTESCPPLRADRRADVCIVGGGYTGLWTALQLKAADPSLDVVLIERDLCASGASGRNAGMLMSWWSKFLSLRKVCGEEEALRIAQASDDAVSSVIKLCKENDIDAHIRQDGWLWSASNKAQVGLWNETIESIGRHGLSPIVEWSQADIALHSGTSQSSPHMAGAYEAKVATVQPALLGRGLRRVALERGVKIFEKTPLVSLSLTNPAVVKTPEAKITADKVVIAMNAWATRWDQVRQAVLVVAGDIIVTEPIGDRLEKIGLTDGLGVSDGRALIEYYRTTLDGRLAFGKGGMSGGFTYGSKVGGEVEGASAITNSLTKAMRTTFPDLGSVGVYKSWRGPIDRSKSGLPFFWHLGRRRNVFFAAGFSGNGIGPSHIAGKILSGLALEKQDEWTACPLVRDPNRDFPPEPFRYIGSKLVQKALQAKDINDNEGRESSRFVRFLTDLAPSGLSPFRRNKK
tara:strand:- start:186 stop:1613 length:1428 start_codon:yes stop_codon:yes gene_type:complete